MKSKMHTVIEFEKVTFAYPQGPPLFTDLTVKLQSGAFYLIKGASGAGKSSFLRLINRLEEPQAGVIRFNGRDLASYRPQDLRRAIIYIQQTPVVVDGTVKENLLLPFTFKKNAVLTPPSTDKLQNLLQTFHLEQLNLNDNAQNLSVGQRQRLCLIRGMLLSPAVTLMDEPTSALDEDSSRIVESAAFRLCREFGQTVIMVSHRAIQIQPLDSTRHTTMRIADGHLEEIV